MKRKTIVSVTAALLFVNFAFIGASLVNKSTGKKSQYFPQPAKEKTPAISKDILSGTKDFISANGYSKQVCFIINMSLPSGSNRFFIYDLKKDSITDAAVVTHGRCNEKWLEGRKYSNVVGSGCTSLGKYKIGKPYYGKFGLAYKLYGLDSSNNKAFERYVVLHSHECVPEFEVETEICQSDGCPTVSPGYLKKLQKIIDESGKPILLLIY